MFISNFNLSEHEQFPAGYFQYVLGGGKSAQLRLFDLDDRDFGTYTCKAFNRFGASVKEFRVVRAGEFHLCIVCLSTRSEETCFFDLRVESPLQEKTSQKHRLP